MSITWEGKGWYAKDLLGVYKKFADVSMTTDEAEQLARNYNLQGAKYLNKLNELETN